MDKKIKIVIAIAVLLLVILAIIIAINFININKNNKENQIEEQNVTNDIEENLIEEPAEENEIEESETEVEPISQEPEVTVQEPVIVGREEQESTQYNQGQSEEEKVIEIAKNKWGSNDNSVYYVIEAHDGDLYHIAVRNNETTAAKAWYTVNGKTGEIVE